MTGDPEHETLDELTARIQQAGKIAKMEQDAARVRKEGEPIRFSRVGFDFVATIAGCAVAGWLIDYVLHTRPWGLLGMMLVGFIAAITNVWRDLGGYGRGIPWNEERDDDEDD